ncbi:MAG: hypothetical protein MR024_03385 [Firmicutes bacterium]|nr:hypothetical protein [Bacillota bacterium]
MEKEIVKIVLPYAVLSKETYIEKVKEVEIANNEKHSLNIFTNSTKINTFIDAVIATGKVSAEQRKEHFARDMKKIRGQSEEVVSVLGAAASYPVARDKSIVAVEEICQ